VIDANVVMEVHVAGWPVLVVEVVVHGRCTAAGAAWRAWSTGWGCTKYYCGVLV